MPARKYKVNVTGVFFSINTLIAISLLFNSCNDKEEKLCGCKSNDVEAISNSYCSVFIFNEYPVLICLDKGYVTLCDSTATFDNGHILKEVNGNIQSKCQLNVDTAYAFNETYIYKASYFELNSFNDYTETLVNNPITWKHFQIEVIRSEDFGYSNGFGFRITNTNTGFILLQPYLPSVAGFITCQNEKDAMKVAFLYVSKAYLYSSDFADILEEELQFIGVYTP